MIGGGGGGAGENAVPCGREQKQEAGSSVGREELVVVLLRLQAPQGPGGSEPQA